MAEPTTGRRQPGLRDVLILAVGVVAVVLGLAAATSLLPTERAAGRLRYAAAHRGPHRRHGLVAVAGLTAAAGPTRSVTEPASTVADPHGAHRGHRPPRHRRRGTSSSSVAASSGAARCWTPPRAGCGPRSIEQDDIAAGTSSRSSRLIHGGLRYLEQFRFGLVRQALAERRRLLELAPHLVRIEPLLFPIYGIPFLSKAFYDAGLTLYDILGARHDGGWHQRLSKAATLELAPTLRQEGLRGGLVYHDGVEDDARYTLAVARTAQAAGRVGGDPGPCHGRSRRPAQRRARGAPARTDLATGAELDDPDASRRGRDRASGRPRPVTRSAAGR